MFDLFPQGHYYGMQFEVYGNGTFWLCMLLVLVVCTIPRLSYYFIQNELYPSMSDTVRRKEAHMKPSTRASITEFKPQLTRRRSSKRSSYAFAHQEGFGKIVMSPATFLRRKFGNGNRAKNSTAEAM